MRGGSLGAFPARMASKASPESPSQHGSVAALSSRARAFSVAALIAADTPTERNDGTPLSAFRPPRRSLQSNKDLGEGGAVSAVQSPKSEIHDVRVQLNEQHLWRRFHELHTEMIVTKAGRRMFPILKLGFGGLDPKQKYCLYLDMVMVDDKRYKYAYHDSQWLVAGKADSNFPSYYVHPDSPSTGTYWMKQIVSFDKVKLTNNDMPVGQQLVLNSMHKYRPRLIIVRTKDGETPPKLSQLSSYVCWQFTFPETEFMAVTAYQNQQITKLKIDCNPFAKGFRESREGGRFNIESCLEAFYKYTPTVQKREASDHSNKLPSNISMQPIPTGYAGRVPMTYFRRIFPAQTSANQAVELIGSSTWNSSVCPAKPVSPHFVTPVVCSNHYSNGIAYSVAPPFSAPLPTMAKDPLPQSHPAQVKRRKAPRKGSHSRKKHSKEPEDS